MSQASPSVERVQLLVVGAGPVGLFAALCAARRGLDVTVVDHVFRGYAGGRAALVHGTALALLSELGLASAIQSNARRIERVSLHVDRTCVSTQELPNAALSIPQRVLEETLLNELRAVGVSVRVPYSAATIEQQDSHVDVRLLRRELTSSSSPVLGMEWEPVESTLIQAEYVIGADGYESRVRSALGVDVVEMGGLETFAIFEAALDHEIAAVESLFFHDGLAGLMLPLPNGRVRLAFQLSEQLDARPDVDFLRSLMSARSTPVEKAPLDVDWGTVMHFERRLARRFGKGRVWLAGDAAHVTSPLGGQSLNLGLLEAHSLVRRIAEGSDLGRHAAEFEREWHKLFGVNVRFEILPHAPAWLPAHARRLVPALPASGHDLTVMLERMGLRLS